MTPRALSVLMLVLRRISQCAQEYKQSTGSAKVLTQILQ